MTTAASRKDLPSKERLPMPNGSIKHYDNDIGQGMIEPSDRSRDVFFTRAVVKGGVKWVFAGVQVMYKLYEGNGDPEAKLVKRIS